MNVFQLGHLMEAVVASVVMPPQTGSNDLRRPSHVVEVVAAEPVRLLPTGDSSRTGAHTSPKEQP